MARRKNFDTKMEKDIINVIQDRFLFKRNCNLAERKK